VKRGYGGLRRREHEKAVEEGDEWDGRAPDTTTIYTIYTTI